MKIKDLEKDTLLDSVLVELPEKIMKENSYVGLKQNKVYIVSLWGSGIWVKENLTSNRVYPISLFSTSEILNLKIVEK